MPEILQQTILLLTRPPGDLVYHLIVLFALEAILGLAVVRAHRAGWQPRLRAIGLAATGLLLLRLGLIALALLALQGLPPGLALNTAVIPPLERAIDLIGLGLLAWATLPMLFRRPLGTVLLIVNTLAAIVVYFALAPQWQALAASPDVFFPATAPENIWQVWALALAGLSSVVALIARGEARVTTFAAFALLAAGHALQLAAPVAATHAAGWVRLTQLAAYPMFVIVAYQLAQFDEAPATAAPIEPRIPRDSTVPQPIWQTLGAIQNVERGDDLALALQQVAVPLALAVQADLLAIALGDVGDPSLELVAIHHPGAAPLPGASFQLQRQPNVKRALERRRPIAISVNDSTPELVELFGLLGSFVPGPLLIVPMYSSERALGVALFGNPISRREWSASEIDRAQVLTNHLALALAAAQQRQSLTRAIDDLQERLRTVQADADVKRRSLENALQNAQAEAQRAALQLAALAKLQDALSAQRGTDEARVEQLAAERAQLELVAQERQAEIDRLLKLQAGLDYQLQDAQRLIAELRDETPRASATPDETAAALGRQREVIAGIVQELRTPMTSITGYTDLLLGESVGILGAMQRQFMQRIKANIERMDGMLNDLINVSAIDSGALKIEPEAVDVPEVIQDTVLAAAPLFSDRELSVRVELPDQLPRLQTDRDSLHQIIKHLLSNAALCSPTHSEIVVRAQVPPDMPNFVLFSVTDQGGGIAPEDRQRAFNRMYRADHPLVQGLGETGVGLSISKTLVEAQGGRIWVDSDMGAGSTFTFVLPVHANHAELTP